MSKVKVDSDTFGNKFIYYKNGCGDKEGVHIRTNGNFLIGYELGSTFEPFHLLSEDVDNFIKALKKARKESRDTW